MPAITVFHHIPKTLKDALQLDPTTKASWEQKALEALETSDGDKTKLIIQLVPIANFDAIKAVLQKRQVRQLDAILAAAQREWRASPLPVTAPNNPIREGQSDFTNVFADGLHSKVINRVRQIRFAGLGRYVFGIEEHTIQEVTKWASDLSQSLHHRYMFSPGKRGDYKEVEKVFNIIP
jgi:hypothetical protein